MRAGKAREGEGRRGKAREGEGTQRTIDHFITQLWARFITNMSLIKLQILYIPLSSSGFNLTKYLGQPVVIAL